MKTSQQWLRLRKHADRCNALHQLGLWQKNYGQLPLRVVKTNHPETEAIHRATARCHNLTISIIVIFKSLRYMFANNVPFSSVTSPHWVQLMGICRPGLKPLSRYSIVHKHLPEEYDKERQALVKELEGRMVTMSADGWTAPLNQSALGIALDKVPVFICETLKLLSLRNLPLESTQMVCRILQTTLLSWCWTLWTRWRLSSPPPRLLALLQMEQRT